MNFKSDRTSFLDRYDALVFVASERGVCPKIIGASSTLEEMHYCGKPLVPGTRWCREHQR